MGKWALVAQCLTGTSHRRIVYNGADSFRRGCVQRPCRASRSLSCVSDHGKDLMDRLRLRLFGAWVVKGTRQVADGRHLGLVKLPRR